MKQQAVSTCNMQWLPITGLIIFVVCFTAYTYWTFRKDNKAKYEMAAKLPMDEEIGHE